MQAMEHELDVRGARCPVPYVRARQRIAGLAPGDVLVIHTTDPEARIDLAALAADHGLAMETEDGETIRLRR